MSDIFYSVEWIPKDDRNNCWNQEVLTDSWFLARLHYIETRLGRGRKNRYRIREV